MITEYYSVYDMKAQVWLKPTPAQTRGMMLRTFADIANDKEHPIGQHPEDYCLYLIAEFNDITGKLTVLEKEVSLGTAISFVKTSQEK